MKSFITFFTLIFIINYIQNQKPEDITIFNIPTYGTNSYFHEFAVSKNEIFGFRFSKGRGVPSNWLRFSNSSKIKFLYSRIHDYVSESYQK